MSKMNQDPSELRELLSRRPLRPAEQAQLEAWLAMHPEARADWAADAALSALLARLPEQPAPSNLTARVLAEIGREEDLATAGARKTKTNWVGLGSWGWVTRAAVVVALVGLGAFVVHRQQQVKVARNIVAVAKTAPELSPEVLEEFDAIYLLPPPLPGADLDLLAVMK